MTTDSNVVETIFKTKESYNECDHCQSVLSPAAYFVKLVETIKKYIPGHKLKERRPDLFELPLDYDSTNKTKLYLEIANEIMEKNLDKKLGGNALQKLATAKYPFNLPANFPLISIRAYLEKQGITLADLYKVLKPEANNVAESLGLSPEEYDLITSTNFNSSEVYGASESELKNVERFIAQTNIDHDKLGRLIDCYNKIKNPTNKLSINSGTINNLDQTLSFLHRFIRLANKLGWSFDELCNVLLAIDKNEIAADSLKEISRIKSLQEKLKKTLSEVCKLYQDASISIEESKSEEDANNAVESLFFLQRVKESDLKKIYGIEEPSEPLSEKNFGEYVAEKGIKRQEVERLLDNYKSTTHSKKAKKREKISVKEQKFLHNFDWLTERFKLLFKQLSNLTKALSSEFKLKDLVANIDNSIVLQKIWNISKEELTSLINYNDKVSSKAGKSLILEVHKQILLARLMNISIAEVIQILLQLNISELTINNVEHVIELSDWLSNNSITIEQLSTLVNSSALSHKYTEQISKICEELERDPELKRDEKAFHNLVLQCIGEQLNEEGLAATHEFTKKQPTNLQLLRLESLDKSIVHDVGIIGQKAVFLGESKVLKKDLVEHAISEPRENVAVATVGAKTIFFGGKKSTNEYSKKIDIYDEDTGSWSTEVASEARDSAAVAVVGSKAIFFGGNKNDKECSSKIDTYDVVSGEWKENAPNASEARSNASVGVIGDKAIFFGGEIGQERSSKIDIYENGNWTTHIASEARSNASVAIVDTKVIFFGGNKGSNQPSAKIDIYDAADIDIYRTDPMKRWTTHTVGEARENASVAIVDGKAIFFGGKADQTKSNKIDIYDAKTEKWLAVDYTASEARDAVSVTVVGKQAVFFGGCKGNQQYSKCMDVYDSATNSWKATGEINEAHENVSAIVIGAKAIFFTGKKSGTVTGQVYIYDSTNYSKDDSIVKSWIKRTAKETETQDDLLVDITNSTKYSGKIDIYGDIAKSWKAIDLYKPDKCKSIRIHNNRATLTYQDMESSTYDRTYTVGLSITYDATIEELLNNATVFTMLKMDAEDINNITDHANTYKLEAVWTKEQIKTLANYKALQDEFSGNELTLSQYTEWLRDSYDESKVTEKIAQLTNWDKKILDIIKNIKDKTKLVSLTNWDENVQNLVKEVKAFEQCFNRSNHPIDSILTIKSFIDVIERSTIDGKVLLKLGALHDLKADDAGWKIYKDTEQEIKSSLSYVEGVKEQLEDQKRNVLANYMIYGCNNSGNKMYADIKNMRNLYSFLLIDIEMSDCSKISPLKAGLNSLQLYIHRCILGLEEGVTVNQDPEKGLSEEMWDLLDNYREWEVTKKIALYPENYLNPTLRKSATAEYKALQNTLMQGNLTDEEAANAYIKYFEDFAQLVNLQIVDTCFISEKNELYILGRTIAEPYTYYYRVGNFKDGKTGSQQIWEAWQKIEAQVPVSIARIVHVFGRMFVFWLQKTEKEKQVENLSINDSTLAVHYMFKKADGSWSAQQKLPFDVKIDEKCESHIRQYFSSRNWEKGQQELCESWKAKDEEKKVNYSKNGEWITDRPVEEAIEYFKSKVKEWDKSIKDKVKESKDIKFNGKLKVAAQNSEILILSCEDGFQNSKFILKEDLTSERSYTRYFNSMSDVVEAEKSITEFYNKKKDEEKNIVTRQINEMQKKIDKKKARENDKQSELISLENKKDGEKRSKDALQSKVNSVEQSIKERRRLWQDIENLKVKLNNLFPHRSSDSYEEAAERGNLRAVINNLKQELTQYKQNVESTNAGLQQELITLETETATLINNIAKLATEEAVDDNLQKKTKDIVKRLSDLQLQEAQLDPLEESGEKRKLRAAADNLKQKLALLKQSTESKKVELLEQLTELETKVTNLEIEINRLQEPEKTIKALKKEKGILEESIKQHEKEIKKLDDEIKKYEKEKEYLRNGISQLQKDKKEIEDGNNKIAEQERHKQLDKKGTKK